MNTEGHDCGIGGIEKHNTMIFSLADKWIISRLQETKKQVIESLNTYRLDLAAQAIYEFTWNEYCDWYLELSKSVLSTGDSESEQTNAQQLKEQQQGTRYTLVHVLENLLRITHPIMPYITEEIWQRVAPLAGTLQNSNVQDSSPETIMLQPYPEPDNNKINQSSLDEMNWLQQFVLGVRQIRSGYDIKPGKPLTVLLQNGSATDKDRLLNNEAMLKKLARLETIKWLEADDEVPESSTALVGEMQILIPMAGLIDIDAERQRLNKEIGNNQGFIKGLEAKLSNENFVSRAPEKVVALERQKLSDAQSKLKSLSEQLEKLKSL
jgi:valyl-tRNA synthetase